MRPDATALANYFIDLAVKGNVELRQFGLMKRIYIAHGFCLAHYDMSALDPRFDVVEAWKNGPVIPSIYHSFKHNKNNPIMEKSVIVDFGDDDGLDFDFKTPELSNEKIIHVADFVWDRYMHMTDFELIKLTHRKGTPWAYCYREGKNNPIPDSLTKLFYKKLLI